MSNRPNPAQFAQYSYILAITSAGILALAFLLSVLSGLLETGSLKSAMTTFAGTIVWLVLLTGSIGAFMGYAANVDFKSQSVSADLLTKARIGFRINLGALIVTLLLAILSLVFAFLARMGGNI